jgi:hypothetical protein
MKAMLYLDQVATIEWSRFLESSTQRWFPFQIILKAVAWLVGLLHAVRPTFLVRVEVLAQCHLKRSHIALEAG